MSSGKLLAVIGIVALVGVGVYAINESNESDADKVGDAIEDAADDVGDAAEDVADEVEDATDGEPNSL